MVDSARTPVRSHRPWRRARCALGGLALLLVVGATVELHDDYGVTWDEGLQATYGERALDYFLSGGADTRVLGYAVLSRYGPAFEIAPAALYRWLGLPKYRTRHLFLGLLALLAFPGVALVARRFGTPWAASLSVLALLMLPRFIGHAFNNSKDIPFAVAVVWFILAAGALFADRDLRWSRVAACGTALGVALWGRPGALPLLVLWLAVAATAEHYLGGRRADVSGVGGVARTGAAALAVVAVAWLVMVLPWPSAHENPLAQPVAAVGTAARFPVEVPVLFKGVVYPSGGLPRRYAIELLAITTPPGLLLLALLGGFRSLSEVLRGRGGRRRATAALLLAWAVLPLAAAVLLQPRLYDGIRHLLFVLPALALLAGFGGAWLVERASEPRWRGAALAGVSLLLLAPLPSMVRLHPYQMTYFNAFVGGTGGADGRFETDYWASSYAEAMRWINQQVTGERQIRVLVAGTSLVRPAAEHAAASGVEVVLQEELRQETDAAHPIDYYLATTRQDFHLLYPQAPVVHTVGRAGATFTVVKRLRKAEGVDLSPLSPSPGPG